MIKRKSYKKHLKKEIEFYSLSVILEKFIVMML